MRKLSSATGSGSSIVGYSLVVAGLLFGDLVVFGAGKPARPDLEKYLQRIGYEPILLERDEDNHLTVRALLDGRKRNFMVDTGWAMTTVSKATVRRLKTLGELGVKLEDSFLGTLSDSSMVLMEKLTLGPADFLNQPAEAMKLNMEGRSFGHDGVLGCDFLVRNQCLIDCLDKRLYVRRDKAPVEVLAALKKTLAGSGFSEVRLNVKLNLAMTCNAKANGRPVKLLVDTGAIWSLFDESQVKPLGLKVRGTGMKVVGVGRMGSQIVMVSRLDSFEFEGVSLQKVDFGVADLKGWGIAENKGLLENVQGILGAELLAKNGALIDCRGLTLWLRPLKSVK